MRHTTIAAVAALFAITAPAMTSAGAQMTTRQVGYLQPVSGEGVHYFSTALIHTEEVIPTGVRRQGTEIIALTGDLTGKVLYHPTTKIDGARHVLTNTGTQVFSGTVLGGPPVLLLDDSFTFTADLKSGRTDGTVFFNQTLAGPHTECRLTVSGTGETTEAGDSRFTYEGECIIGASTERASRD